MKILRYAKVIVLVACAGCAVRTPPPSQQENCLIGSATMREDRSIFMMLRAEGPKGLIGDAAFEYKPGDPEYAEVLRHIGPIEPGQDKPVPCWPEGKNAKHR